MFWSRNKRGARFCDVCKGFAVDTLFNDWPAELGASIRRFARRAEAEELRRAVMREHYATVDASYATGVLRVDDPRSELASVRLANGYRDHEAALDRLVALALEVA
jgi:hypothetical protein